MRAPTNNNKTQGIHGAFSAVDYSALPDPNIYAPEDGKVTSYGAAGTCGNNLQITSGGNVHGFCHLERATVAVGQWVSKGQVVGIMGYTGYTIPAGAAGRHLHWVVRRNGVYVYPPNLVNESSITQGSTVMNGDYVKNQYRYVAGREPSQGEVDFHVKNSTPQSLYDGFARHNELAVPKLQAQLNGLAKQVTELSTNVTSLQQQIQPLKTENDQLKVENAALKKVIADTPNTPPPDPDSVVITKNSLWDIFKGWFKK